MSRTRRTVFFAAFALCVACWGALPGQTAQAQESTPDTREDYLPVPAPKDVPFTDPSVYERLGFIKLWESELPGETIDEWWMGRRSLMGETDKMDRKNLKLWSIERTSGIVKWQVPLEAPIRFRPVETTDWVFWESEHVLHGANIKRNPRTQKEVGILGFRYPLDWAAVTPPPTRLNNDLLPPSNPAYLSSLYQGVIASNGNYFNKHTGWFRSRANDDSVTRSLRAHDRNFYTSSPIAADFDNPVHVFIGSYDDRMYAINIQNRIRDWKFRTYGDIRAEPIVRGDKVYFISEDGRIYLCDERWGMSLNTFRTENGIAGAMGVDGDILYVASSDTNLYALHRLSLELLTKFRTGVPLYASPQGITSPEAGTRVYFRSGVGEFTCLRLARGGSRLYPKDDQKAKTPDSTDADGAQFVESMDYGEKVEIRYRPRFIYNPPGGGPAQDHAWKIPGGLNVVGVGQKRYADSPRNVYVLKEGNILAAVNDDTGEIRWEYPLKEMSHILPLTPDENGVYQPILYMATRDGRAYAFMERYEMEKRRWEKAIKDNAREVEESRKFDQAVREIWSKEAREKAIKEGKEKEDNMLRRMEKELRGVMQD